MAWHKIAILGLLACGIAAGCTVTSDDDEDTDGGDAAGGSDGAGGSNAGGRASGGAATGGGASGGSSAGGSGAGGAEPDGGNCTPAANDNDCQKCVLTKCCAEYFDCNDDACAGDGTAANPGELSCFQDCMAEYLQDAGTADSDTVQACSGRCASQGSTLATNTEDIVTCILSGGDTVDGGTDGCDAECYGVDIAMQP